ncbi:cytochrome P450 [Mycena amicta]|nr:cytochrome P450 [Mycena amicta]
MSSTLAWNKLVTAFEQLSVQAQNVHPSSAVVAVLGIYAVIHAIDLFNLLRTKSFFPRVYTTFQPFALPGVLLPTTAWSTGYTWHWVRRFQTYTRSETVQLVPIFSGISNLWTSNIDIARQVVVGANRSKFFKPEEGSRAFLMWGMNVVAADGLMWRKHRRIVGPAFGVDLYKLVWQQSRDTYNDFMHVDGWDREGRKTVDVPVIQDITLKFAFLIISNCGFGFPSTWAAPPSAKAGEITVQEALRIAADHHLLMLTVPKWAFYLPIPKLLRIRKARERLMAFMHEQVAERKAEVASAKELRSDAFTMLVKANQDEDSKYSLDDEELIGNIFVFMFAGHETTAHTLAATLAFMALHEDIQEEVVEQILDVVGSERDPIFEDYGKLDKVLAIFYEAARMFPAGHVLIREASEDTILQVPNPVGEEGTTAVPIQKGTQVSVFDSQSKWLTAGQIIVDMIGLQYNPRYCENPEEYRPSRWYGLPTDSEQFTAFSIGPRACIGRRFATVEATCFLAMLLRDWTVRPLLREGETREAWKARIMNAHIVLTLGVGDIPLRFERRSSTRI